VTFAAKPRHVIGPFIIRVVCLRLVCPALFAGLALYHAMAQRSTHGQVGDVGFRIALAPPLLPRKGFGLVSHAATPQKWRRIIAGAPAHSGLFSSGNWTVSQKVVAPLTFAEVAAFSFFRAQVLCPEWITNPLFRLRPQTVFVSRSLP